MPGMINIQGFLIICRWPHINANGVALWFSKRNPPPLQYRTVRSGGKAASSLILTESKILTAASGT
jgi:hypothetical protein